MITLKTLGEATAQQVFDQVATHLLTQKVRSTSDHPDLGKYCMYRGVDGNKCAAGCLISDDEYDRKMEGNSWGGIISEFNVTLEHEKLIKSLQKIHDTTHPSEWLELLEDLATKNNLTFNN